MRNYPCKRAERFIKPAVFFLLPLLLTGCYSYNISTPTPAFLREPQEIKTEAMVSGTGPEVKVAFAPIKYVILQADWKLHYNASLAGGLSYAYKAEDEYFLTELMAGYGKGEARRRPFPIDGGGSTYGLEHYTGEYQKRFIHFGLGVEFSKGQIFGAAIRMNKVDYVIKSIWDNDVGMFEDVPYDFMYAEFFLTYQSRIWRNLSAEISSGINVGDKAIHASVPYGQSTTLHFSEETHPVEYILLRFGFSYHFNRWPKAN